MDIRVIKYIKNAVAKINIKHKMEKMNIKHRQIVVKPTKLIGKTSLGKKANIDKSIEVLELSLKILKTFLLVFLLITQILLELLILILLVSISSFKLFGSFEKGGLIIPLVERQV